MSILNGNHWEHICFGTRRSFESPFFFCVAFPDTDFRDYLNEIASFAEALDATAIFNIYNNGIVP